MDKEKNIKDLEFVEKILSEIQSKNESSDQLSIGMLYGLIFGIIGNAYVSLLFMIGQDFLAKWGAWILIILSILICIALSLFIRDSRRFKEDHENIDKERDRILKLKEDIEENRISMSNKDLRQKHLILKKG